MDSQLLITIGGSAAVGALVSSGITAIAQWRERKSRREELLLSKAMELAHAKTETMARVARTSRNGIWMEDQVVMTERYYVWLLHLMNHGTLPNDPQIERFREETEA